MLQQPAGEQVNSTGHRLRVAGTVAALAVAACTQCSKDQPIASLKFVPPDQIECMNLVADLGRPVDDDQVVVRRFDRPGTAPTGPDEAPELAKRVVLGALAGQCTDPTKAERLLRTAICLTPPDSELTAEAIEAIMQLHSDAGFD